MLINVAFMMYITSHGCEIVKPHKKWLTVPGATVSRNFAPHEPRILDSLHRRWPHVDLVMCFASCRPVCHGDVPSWCTIQKTSHSIMDHRHDIT